MTAFSADHSGGRLEDDPIMRKMLSAAGIAAFFLLISCSAKKLPSNAVERFSDCFVNPTSHKLDSLARWNCSRHEWDSIIAQAHAIQTRPGEFAQLLTDSAGLTYSLGFKTPAVIRPDTLYPLIVYLHGGVGTTSTNKGEKAWDMLSPLSDSLQIFLSSPSGNRQAPWWSPLGIGRILQSVRYMALKYPIDPRRIFLAGVSDGTTGCYAVANACGSPFAGFFAISGYGGILPQMKIPLFPSNLMQRPIYNCNAGKDDHFPIAYVNQFLNWLDSNGVMVTRSFYPEEKHGFDYREKEFGKIAALLRAWQRPDTRGVSCSFFPGYPASADHCVSWEYAGQKTTFPYIRAHWVNDTIVIETAMLKSITLSFDSLRTPDRIFVKVNSQKPQPSGSLAFDARTRLRSVIDGCVLRPLGRDRMFRIQCEK